MMRIAGLAVVFLAAVSLPAQPAGAGGAPSRDKEVALGERLAAEFRARAAPLGSVAVQRYLDGAGRRLAAQFPHGLPFTFETFGGEPPSPAHEAVVLPGGYIFVPAALFLTARDEAEFSAALAHAMAHSALRHGFQPARPPAIARFDAVGGSPEQELEADRMAAEVLARAGIDPMARRRYIDRESSFAAIRREVARLVRRPAGQAAVSH